MKIAIDASELRKVSADLALDVPRIGKEAAAIIREGGEAIAEHARRIAPVLTGALRADIDVSFAGDGRSAGMAAVIHNNTSQGFFQEFSTSRHPAQPSLGPALKAEAPAVFDALAEAAGGLLS